MAEQTIDKLQVEVEASAKGTTAVFAKLEGQLATLQKALSAIDTSKLEAVGKATNSARPKIDTSGISKAQRDIASSVAKIQQSLAGLGAYANAAMGGDKSAFHSYERGATRLQSTIDVLKSKFEQLGNTSIPTEAFQKLDREIENTKSQLDGLEAKLKKGTDSGGKALSGQEMAELKQAAQEASDKITELQNKQRALANEGKATYDPFAPYKEALSQVDEKLQATTQKVREAYAAMNETPAVDTSGIEEVEKSAGRARTSLISLFGGAVKNALDSLLGLLKRVSSALTGIGKNADGFFNKGFMRILKYGFGIRSIYVLFRRLRKAVTESFGELQNSGAFFETTRANVEALKSALSTLKFQFGAAFEPIFNAVAPALETFVNYLITVMNVISAFMAKLTGKSTYSKVSATFGKVASGAGGAGKAVKDLNKQLQGFDELNNLSGDNPSGGGGGGGGGASEGGAEYVEASVESVLGDFGTRLADMIRAGDWRGVGQAISDKLSEAMESIRWNDVFDKARNFGHNLAEFLNGLINPRLFENIGRTIGNLIMTGLIFFDEWGKTMDWENVGNSLAEGFNAFIKTGWIGQLGETLHTWIAGGLVALTKFFEDADFEELGNQIAEFIGNLDIPDLAVKLVKLAKSILLALADAIKGLWNNGDVTTRLGLAIVGIIGFAKLTGLAGVIGGLISSGLSGSTITASAAGASLKLTGLKAITGLALTVGGTIIPAFSLGDNTLEDIVFDLFGGVGTYAGLRLLGVSPSMAIKITLAKVTWDVAFDLGRSLFAALSDAWGDSEMADYYRNFSWANFFPDLFEAAKTGNLSKGLKSMFTGPADSIGNTASEYATVNPDALEKAKEFRQIVDEIKESLNNPFGDKNTSDFGTSILNAWQAFSGSVEESSEAFSKLGVNAKTATKTIKDATTGTKKYGTASSKASTEVKTSLDSIPSTVSAMVTSVSTGIEMSMKSMPTTVQSYADNAWRRVKDAFSETSSWSREKSGEVSGGFSDLPSKILATFRTAYRDGTNEFSGASKWATGKSGEVVNGFSGMPEDIKTKFNSAYTKGTSQFNNTKTWIDGVVTTIKKSAAYVPTDFNNIFDLARNNATKQMQAFGTWFSSQKYEKEASVTVKTPAKDKIQSAWNEVKAIWKDIDASLTFEASGSNSFNVNEAVDSLNDVIHEFNYQASLAVGKMVASGAKMKFVPIPDIGYRAAQGGIVTQPTGVLVGDAGPEALVPLENNLGWLHKMANMIVGEMTTPSAIQTAAYNGISHTPTMESSVAQQNALLQEQNMLLRQIASKDYTIGTKQVFDAVRDEANNYYNRTGNSPFFD